MLHISHFYSFANGKSGTIRKLKFIMVFSLFIELSMLIVQNLNLNLYLIVLFFLKVYIL